MLAIEKYIKKHGLDKAISNFKLKTREYDHKILLKYDQLVCPTLMGLPEMKDCRGLILEKNTFKVMSLAFKKFFNLGESNADKIDMDTACVLEKLDGTLIQLYWDWVDGKWYAGTTGTANGEGNVNNKLGRTFNDLFFDTIKKYPSFDINLLDREYCFVFELTTPYNIVVKPHSESSVTLLTVRNLETLKEMPRKKVVALGGFLKIPVVKSYDLNSKETSDILKTFEDMPWTEEGYVMVDAKFNRVKIKNPAYLAMHYLKGKTAEHNILTIIKANEIEEFIATFAERKEEIYQLKENYDKLISNLNLIWDELKQYKLNDMNKEDKKNYAVKVFEICNKHNLKEFSNLYFYLIDNKVSSVEEYILNYDDKKLYKIL